MLVFAKHQVNQPHIHIWPLTPEPPPHPRPHPTPLGCHRAPAWAPRIRTAAAHWLFYTRYCIYVSNTFLIHPTLSFPHCVHKSVHYACVSIPALKIGSSVSLYYLEMESAPSFLVKTLKTEFLNANSLTLVIWTKKQKLVKVSLSYVMYNSPQITPPTSIYYHLYFKRYNPKDMTVFQRGSFFPFHVLGRTKFFSTRLGSGWSKN